MPNWSMNWRIRIFSPVGGRIFLAADSSSEQLQSICCNESYLIHQAADVCEALATAKALSQALLDVDGTGGGTLTCEEHKPGEFKT